MVKQKFEWDGEQIKTTYEAEKYTPKDILNGLANTRSQVNQMEQQKVQLEQQMKGVDVNLLAAKEHLLTIEPFEEKCVELQKEKLSKRITKISADCIKKAKESSEKTIAKDVNAYSKEQINGGLAYLDYQKLLATDEKVANKISSQIISKYLFQEPVFDNPFKEEK